MWYCCFYKYRYMDNINFQLYVEKGKINNQTLY